LPEVPDGYIPDTDPASYGVGKCADDIPGMRFTIVGTASGSATYAATDVPVFISSPDWWAAKVTLSDICMREIVTLPTA